MTNPCWLWHLVRFSVDNTGSVLPVPTGMPPRMGFMPPTIQGPIAAVPAKFPSHHTSKERRHSKGLSPSTENHTSHLPIGAG